MNFIEPRVIPTSGAQPRFSAGDSDSK